MVEGQFEPAYWQRWFKDFKGIWNIQLAAVKISSLRQAKLNKNANFYVQYHFEDKGNEDCDSHWEDSVEEAIGKMKRARLFLATKDSDILASDL